MELKTQNYNVEEIFTKNTWHITLGWRNQNMENSLHEHLNRGEYLIFFISLTRPPDKILIKIFFVILHPTTDLCFVLPKASRPQYCDTRGRGLVLPPYQLPHAPGGRIIGAPLGCNHLLPSHHPILPQTLLFQFPSQPSSYAIFQTSI